MSSYQTNRTKAANRLKQVEIELDDCRINVSAEKAKPSDTGETLRRLVCVRDDAMSEQGQLEREIDRLDQLIAWERDAAVAEATIKSSRKKIAVAQKELVSLDGRREKIQGRLSKIAGELDELQTKAADGEKAAAQVYAAALAAGDATAEQSAQTKLERAGDLVDEAQRKAARQQPTVNALKAEAENIDQERTLARALLSEMESDQLNAVRLMLSVEWDAAAQSLIAIAARLTTASRLSGGSSTRFDALHIPLLAPTSASRSINHQEVDRLADGLTRDDLLAG